MKKMSIMLSIVIILSISAGMCSEPIDLPMPDPVSSPRKSVAVLFEESLNTLAANNQLPDSFVAVIDPEPQRRNPNQPVNTEQQPPVDNVQFDPSRCGSLDELARVFGLHIFQDKGLYILAPPTTLNLSAMVSGQWVGNEYDLQDKASSLLIASFTQEQLIALGSSTGLNIKMLNAEQRSIFDLLIHPTAQLIHVKNKKSDVKSRVSVADISLQGMTLRCSLRVPYIRLISNGSEYESLISVYDRTLGLADQLIGEWILGDYINPNTQTPLITNNLKPSDLDYSRSELKTVIDIDGIINLRDLVARVAKDSGINLIPCLEAENVKLYIHSGRLNASSILKATALATQSTWRNFGNGYLLVADPLGINQAFIKVCENNVISEIATYNIERRPLSPNWVSSALQLLPYHNDNFILTPQQVQAVANWNGDGPAPLTIDMLTPDQKQFIQQKQQLQDEQQKASVQQYPSHRPITHIFPEIYARMTISVPDFGIINVLEDCLLVRQNGINERLNAQAPSDVSLSIDKPIRGLMLKPEKNDTPESIVSTMIKHDLNMLYLRVFSDGYTIFPCSEFPSRKWVSDAEYLKKIINSAHGKGIKVFAVVDVLRWSDGNKGHWVRKRPELLDYDILGRTQSEWASLGIGSNEHARVEQFLMGDALKGDVVTPLNPIVKDKLRILIRELSDYQLDGLALDQTAIQHTDMGTIAMDDIGDLASYMMMPSGQPGFNRISRAAFIVSHGLDPIDLPIEYVDLSLCIPENIISPVIQVIESSTSKEKIQKDWSNYYYRSCDDLLDNIVSHWQQKKKEMPVWVVDTYSVDLDLTHDWKRFTGRITGTLNTLAMDSPTYPGHSMKRIGLLHASDSIGSLMFASMLARMDGKSFSGMLGPMEPGKVLHAGQGIVIDLACSEKNRKEFLRVIQQSKTPEK